MAGNTRRGRGARAATGFVAASAAVWLALLQGACSQGGALAPRGGGIPEGERAELSLAVAQIRAKYPALQAAQPAYQPVTSDAPPIGERARLALRGAGDAVAPGVLSGKRARLALEFFLDKGSYREGYALIGLDEAPAQRWPILAYELRGDAAREFEFVYLLGDPRGELAYLVVLARDWKEPAANRRSYEATLIRPGEGAQVREWQEAYYIDLGLEHVITPQYQSQIAAADGVVSQLGREVRELAGLRRRHRAAEGDRNRLLEQPAAPEQAEARAKRLVELEGRVGELQTAWEAALHEAEQNVLKFYALRMNVAESFSAFLEGNYYRWQTPEMQGDFFARWDRMAALEREMTGHVAELLPQLADKGPVERTRQRAAETVARFNNAAKRPPAP
ncbi:MAG: hypothetical protein HY342_06425 [Candidatus Lambdaproteobacteria bacterium]|nr:hypothetical protein [Candidatus Lambdaproteobacteria bacterium]